MNTTPGAPAGHEPRVVLLQSVKRSPGGTVVGLQELEPPAKRARTEPAAAARAAPPVPQAAPPAAPSPRLRRTTSAASAAELVSAAAAPSPRRRPAGSPRRSPSRGRSGGAAASPVDWALAATAEAGAMSATRAIQARRESSPQLLAAPGSSPRCDPPSDPSREGQAAAVAVSRRSSEDLRADHVYRIGDEVEVYSKSGKRWCPGRVVGLPPHVKAGTVGVEYFVGEARMQKESPRSSSNLRPKPVRASGRGTSTGESFSGRGTAREPAPAAAAADRGSNGASRRGTEGEPAAGRPLLALPPGPGDLDNLLSEAKRTATFLAAARSAADRLSPRPAQ